MAKMSRQHVPYAGILATLVVYVVGVFLNYRSPPACLRSFLILPRSALSRRGRLSWCARCVYASDKEGKAADVSFKLPGAPFTSANAAVFTKRAGTHGV